jgi:hypothetical protein
MEYNDTNQKERFVGYFSKVKFSLFNFQKIEEIFVSRKKIQRLGIIYLVCYVYRLTNEKDMENY